MEKVLKSSISKSLKRMYSNWSSDIKITEVSSDKYFYDNPAQYVRLQENEKIYLDHNLLLPSSIYERWIGKFAYDRKKKREQKKIEARTPWRVLWR